MTRTVQHAWSERRESPEHAAGLHWLQRNAHLHAEDALKAAFEAGWDARGAPEPKRPWTRKEPKK